MPLSPHSWLGSCG